MEPSRPTLLIFTLGPENQARRHPLLPSSFQSLAASVYGTGLTTALEAGRDCGCRLLVSTPTPFPLPTDVTFFPQRGRGFGQRLAAAFRHAEREGAPVVAVGTDVPDLTAAQVRQALERLSENPHRVVLGPSPDGGLYLLAAARPVAEILSRVPWCRPDTLALLRAELTAAHFEIELLEPLADLDGPSDLETWLATRPGLPEPATAAAVHPLWACLASQLRRVLAAWKHPGTPTCLGERAPAAVSVHRGRAPPHRH